MEQVLLVANPYAGSVSPRTKEVIVKALSADFKLEVAHTAVRNHASDLAVDAVDRGFEAVLAFGGDGTVNEVAQGLVGSDVALGILPGGSTNVMARALGIPVDAVEATPFVAARLRSNTKRRINVGRINDRYFLFSTGMGIDAEVVKRVEADPAGKKTHGERLFLKNALQTALTRYRGADPVISMQMEGDPPVQVVTALCCNARPFTYFKRLPIDACPTARLDEGLDLLGIKRIGLSTIPRLAFSLFVSRSHPTWSSIHYRHDVSGAVFSSSEALPVQVDGDYIGELTDATVRLVPGGLDILV